MARRLVYLLAEVLAVPVGLVVSLGLIDVLRSLPGTSVALALPLRETGHADRAPFIVVAAVSAIVFALVTALAGPRSARSELAALARAAGLLGCALVVQAASLQFVLQASAGFDWGGAVASPAPYVCGLGALLGGMLVATWPAGPPRAEAEV